MLGYFAIVKTQKLSLVWGIVTFPVQHRFRVTVVAFRCSSVFHAVPVLGVLIREIVPDISQELPPHAHLKDWHFFLWPICQ